MPRKKLWRKQFKGMKLFYEISRRILDADHETRNSNAQRPDRAVAGTQGALPSGWRASTRTETRRRSAHFEPELATRFAALLQLISPYRVYGVDSPIQKPYDACAYFWEDDLRKLRQLFAIVVFAGVLVVTPLHARPSSAPLGIVTGAQRATVGQVIALDGTSLYDGDILTTDSVGIMRLRFGGSQMALSSNTIVRVNKTDAGVTATLLAGMVRFACVPGSKLELHTLKVVEIRAKGDKPATGQLSVVAPNAFQIGSTKGDLVVSVNGNERDVPESSAYRVTLEDPDPASPQITAPAGKSMGLWIAIGAVAVGTAIAVTLAFMSPSKPN